MNRALATAILFIVAARAGFAQQTGPDQAAARAAAARFEKREVLIPMRDGVKLHTTIFVPRDRGARYPILLRRTPYSCAPYGSDYPEIGRISSNAGLLDDGYVFAIQDVRGRFMSEGVFEDVRPHNPKKSAPTDIDESSDTFDTIEWLVKNVPEARPEVGMFGISYPGFYAAMGMIDAHPALRAVSPQAPVADWFFDDFRRHGALYLPHSFNFLFAFVQPRDGGPTSRPAVRFKHGTQDGYDFFLRLGPLANAETRYFKGGVAFWNELAKHPNYDAFWKARCILPHLRNTAPAVLYVGGWFDAEDLYGPLKAYRATEAQNPKVDNRIVMGPWYHGGWARVDGDRLGHAWFASKTSLHYRENYERAFFAEHLHRRKSMRAFEAAMFDTGKNEWQEFDRWPPSGFETAVFHFEADGALTTKRPKTAGADEFLSDPDKPVPYTEAVDIGMTKEFMTDDQRFAARRPDVLSYRTEALAADVSMAGPITADLWVSTSETDADWIVKVVDVFPDDAPDWDGLAAGRHMSGYQMLVRAEVIRGRFRNSYEKPEPFVPGQATRVRFELQDVLHTFRKGHRIMVQVQSTWFPLVDRNPQKYVANVFAATESDFRKAVHRVHRSTEHPSAIEVRVR